LGLSFTGFSPFLIRFFFTNMKLSLKEKYACYYVNRFGVQYFFVWIGVEGCGLFSGFTFCPSFCVFV